MGLAGGGEAKHEYAKQTRKDAGGSEIRVTTYDVTARDGSVAPEARGTNARHGPGASAPGPSRFPRSCRRRPRRYWQDVVKLSGNATTVTPRMVAPTSTSWPLGRVVARTGPMIGSRMGTEAILR